jgi:2-C-methyl-D-erythritol 2,4-cyclodiphosphate synthase
MTTDIRVGQGFDVHAVGPGDHVMLGGVRLEAPFGVIAHSDGDVLLHALCDALLGAAGLGDIGQHFPDSDPGLRGISSLVLLDRVRGLVEAAGYAVGNVDLTLLAEAPRLGARRAAIVESIAAALGIGRDRVNLKATTLEKLGALGRREGLAADAVVLLVRR